MRDRTALSLTAGLLAGAALGYLLHPSAGDKPGPMPASPAPAAVGPDMASPGLAVARAAPPELLDRSSAGEDVEDDEIEAVLFEELVIELRTAPPSLTQRTAGGWLALATLKALAGEMDALLDAAGHALAAGASADQVLDVYQHVHTSRWLGAIDALLAAHPEGWDARSLASYARGHGHDAWAFDRLDAALAASNPLEEDLVTDLLDIDPTRACARIEALVAGDAARMDGDLAVKIVKALQKVDRDELLGPFLRVALDAFPFRDKLLTALASFDAVAGLDHARWRVSQKPGDASAWQHIASASFEAGDLEEAGLAYRELIELKPERAHIKRLTRIDPELAVAVGEGVLESTTNDEFVGGLADAYLAAGDRESAWSTFSRALRLDPKDNEWVRAQVLMDPHRAVEEMAERAAKENAHDELLGSYAIAMNEIGRRGEAFEHFRRALVKDSTDGEWMQGLALADAKRALPVLEAHAKKQPDSLPAQAAVGLALARQGTVVAGRTHIEKALRAKPSTLLYEMLTQADPEYGVALIKQRLRAAPADADALKALAEHYVATADRRAAAEAIERIIELEPDNSYWRRRLQFLE